MEINAKEAMIQAGKNLEEVRLEKGFSIESLALLSGVEEEVIISMECGQYNFPMSVLFDLASTLNVDFRRIIVDTELYRGY